MKEIIAKNIVKKLANNGYIAYFAGGCVRDMIMHRNYNDIDITTNATPDIIMKLFPNTIPIGIAFGSIIVTIENHQFEVSTFRSDGHYSNGRKPDNVIYGSSPQQDAQRRDFTINGLFYDPLNDKIFDYVGGKNDIAKKIIRAIGNPYERFKEDRLRMIRAVRFSSSLDFEIESETKKAIINQSSQLFPSVSIERIWQEFNKIAKSSHMPDMIKKLHQLGLLSSIFPSLKDIKIDDKIKNMKSFPKRSPAILFLMELFNVSLNQQISYCDYLKVSNKDKKLVEFVFNGKKLIEKDLNTPITLFEWANFYSNKHSFLCLNIIASHLSPKSKQNFLNTHYQRRKKLNTHIKNIIEKTPIVTSHHLKKIGIKPGKEMGHLLKKAEIISINENIYNSDEIIKRLSKELQSEQSSYT